MNINSTIIITVKVDYNINRLFTSRTFRIILDLLHNNTLFIFFAEKNGSSNSGCYEAIAKCDSHPGL